VCIESSRQRGAVDAGNSHTTLRSAKSVRARYAPAPDLGPRVATDVQARGLNRGLYETSGRQAGTRIHSPRTETCLDDRQWGEDPGGESQCPRGEWLEGVREAVPRETTPWSPIAQQAAGDWRTRLAQRQSATVTVNLTSLGERYRFTGGYASKTGPQSGFSARRAASGAECRRSDVRETARNAVPHAVYPANRYGERRCGSHPSS